MYLNRLTKEQGELFLDLAIHACLTNADFDEQEKTYISQYCDELKFDTVRYQADNDFDTAIAKLLEISTDVELRIVVLELMGIIMSDDVFDEFEKEFMNKLVSKVNLNQEHLSEILALLKELNVVYAKMNDFVING